MMNCFLPIHCPLPHFEYEEMCFLTLHWHEPCVVHRRGQCRWSRHGGAACRWWASSLNRIASLTVSCTCHATLMQAAPVAKAWCSMQVVGMGAAFLRAHWHSDNFSSGGDILHDSQHIGVDALAVAIYISSYCTSAVVLLSRPHLCEVSGKCLYFSWDFRATEAHRLL
eukprot:373626-Pelagomonas_calceolata.AAC.3